MTTGRRRFLQTSALVLGVGFTAGCALPVVPRRPAPDLDDATGWIGFDGRRYRLVVPRAEMGQNIATALAQIACTELAIAPALLDVQLHDTQAIGRVRATVGSESVRDFAVPLAQACATLREAVAAGTAQHRMQPRERPLSALRALQPGAPQRTAALQQGLALVTGQPLFVADVRRPGQCFGRVLRAPASPELASRPLRLQEAAARAVPGFVQLVHDPRLQLGQAAGIGIVARTPAALDAVERALAVAWSVDSAAGADIAAAIDVDARLQRAGRLAHTVHADHVPQDAPWDVDLRIDVPLAAHAAIEPRCAVAEPAPGGGLVLWVGSQDVFYQRDVVARRLGLPLERVHVHGLRVGGAFGGKTLCTVELEAALLATATGRPVKVQWTRAQELQLGFHRPPSSHRIRARLQHGRLQDWWHAFASSHILFTSAALPPWLQRLADLVGDAGVARGAALPYQAAARRTEFDAVRLPVHTGPWRGLGAGPNVLAIESAIDACARHVGVDPVAFRLAHIDDPRLARCLQRVAQAAGWRVQGAAGTPAAAHATLRRGRGVACGIYKAASYAAVVADVEVDTATGAVRVTRLHCAHDCGLVIDADQVRAQCEGNLVWGLGMVLVEHLPVDATGVSASGFADAPIPRFADVPPLHVELVDAGEAPTGAGETAIVAAGAAICNAVVDATGVRAVRLPLRPSDLLAALARQTMGHAA